MKILLLNPPLGACPTIERFFRRLLNKEVVCERNNMEGRPLPMNIKDGTAENLEHMQKNGWDVEEIQIPS